MKQNPFIKDTIDQADIVGRKDELAAIANAIDSTIGGMNILLAIIGPKGVGKTMLLRRAQLIANRSKCLSVYIRMRRRENVANFTKRLLEETIERCIDAVSQKILPLRFEKFFSNDALIAKSRITEQNAVEEFSNTIATIYNKIKNSLNALVFLIDDFDKGDGENATVLSKISSQLEKNKVRCLFIVSTTSQFFINEHYKIIEVKGLTEHEMRELINKLLQQTKIKIGEECMKSLIDDSEGNPAVLLTACWVLFNRVSEKEKLITKGHYIANRSAMMAALGMEIFDEIYENTSLTEREILKLMASEESMRVSEISKKMRKPLGVITRLILRLMKSGNVVRLERGRYKIFNRLYGKYLLLK
jgi:hypothetical protein